VIQGLAHHFVVIIIILFIIFALMISNGYRIFFKPCKLEVDTFTSALYLLTTLIQSLSTIFSITIAILFITAQIYTRARYTQTLLEIYRDPTTLGILLFLFIAIVTNIISLSCLSQIINNGNYKLLNLDILFSITAITFLIPLVLLQMENINSYSLAAKIVKRITIKRILNYHLTQIEADINNPNRYHYKLLLWGHEHSIDDPLRSFHEIVMEAVRNRDRIQLSYLTMLLLQRIARYSGVSYSLKKRSFESNITRKTTGTFYSLFKKPAQLQERLAITIHILHYLIRRAHNLKEEWGNYDTIRQQYVLNIGNLIDALITRQDNDQLVEVCLFGVMHICLDYANVVHYGHYEPLIQYYQLANKLFNLGKYYQATLCLQICAFLRERTLQIPKEQYPNIEDQLLPSLKTIYNNTITIIQSNKNWTPSCEEIDPWYYRTSSYNLYV